MRVTSRVCILIGMLLIASCSLAQGTWDIREPGADLQVKCGECLAALGSKPKEVQFGLAADANKDIWFMITNEAWWRWLHRKVRGYGRPPRSKACWSSIAAQVR